MTEHELESGGFINSHCKFCLKDGNVLHGVIVTSPEDGHGNYCFVPTDKMKDYQKTDKEGKNDEKKLLSQRIDLALIDSCKNL